MRNIFLWVLLLSGSPIFSRETKDSVRIHTELFQIRQEAGGIQTSGTNKAGPFYEVSRAVIYFGFNEAAIENSCMSNKETLLLLDSIFSPHNSVYLEDIRIIGFASPVGTHEYNLQLSERRVSEIKNYLTRKYSHINHLHIRGEIVGADWIGLQKMIVVDPNVPMKPELLALFELSGDYSQLEDRIKHLDNGKVQQYIASHYYPYLQRVVTMVIPRGDSVAEKETIPEQISGVPVGSIKSLPSPVSGLMTESTTGDAHSRDSCRCMPFAVKTNLLYDIALTPNIGVEIPVGRRWSMNATFMRGWWLKKDNTFCWQLEAGGLEGRYWFGGPGVTKVLTGWFAGAFAGAGFYDFQLKRDKGHQGEFFMVGLSGGYSRQIAQTWNLEFAIGAGYLSTDYRRYHVINDLLFKQATYRYKGVLPLKAEVSLIKTFCFPIKKGGTQ